MKLFESYSMNVCSTDSDGKSHTSQVRFVHEQYELEHDGATYPSGGDVPRLRCVPPDLRHRPGLRHETGSAAHQEPSKEVSDAMDANFHSSVCMSKFNVDNVHVFRALLINFVAFACLNFLLYLAGLAAFAAYQGCDPYVLGRVVRKDEVLPFFVTDRMSFIRGMPGLLAATLLSGALR